MEVFDQNYFPNILILWLFIWFEIIMSFLSDKQFLLLMLDNYFMNSSKQ